MEEEMALVQKYRCTVEREKPDRDTDDEEEDDDATRALRRNVAYDLRHQVREILEQPPTFNAIVWETDELDEAYLRSFLIAPVCKKSGNWMKFGRKEQDEIRQAVLDGTILDKKLGNIAETPRVYLKGLKDFMGLYQEELLATFPESLVEGKLHLWQFFKFKQVHFLEVPQAIGHLLDKIESPAMRGHAFSGWRQLLESLYTFLSSSEAQSLFLKRTRVEYDMSEVDLRAEARVQRDQEMTHVKRTIDLLGIGRNYGTFKKEREGMAEEKAEFRSKFEGYHVPDAATAIPKYLSHPNTRKFLEEMVDLATRKVVVKPNKMVQVTHNYVEIVHLKNGHRFEAFKRFTRGQWHAAVRDGPAQYPYQGVDEEDVANPSTVYKDEDGKRFRVMENPHRIDMSNATKDELEEWDLLSGIAAKIQWHKTGSKYPLWLWFSQFDQVRQL